MTKLIKTAEDFGGYYLKAVKTYVGHEGEPLFQGNVYFNNKKIGFFAQGDWGGPADFREFKPKDLEALKRYAILEVDSDFEPETSFICGIMEEIDLRKFYMRKCRTKTLVKFPDHKEEEFCEYNINFKREAESFKKFMDKKYGAGNYIIINEVL